MKNIVLFFLLFYCCTACNDNKLIQQKAVFSCLEKGESIAKLIKESNVKKLQKVFVDIPNLNYLIEVLEDEVMKHEKYTLSQPNIFYNPYGDEYIYTIYANKWIDNGTDWGLSDYLFVLQLAFKYDDNSQKVSVANNRILKDHAGFKKWWFSFIKSYTIKSCKREFWADSFGIIPPPPPPPAIEEWLSENSEN
ncbi:hypothetical protein [Aquimarina sp. SS2-1]|uniref:hypothetical protein n=1 Tax=Aquimarina besae TaxID=3342247 RepID=UPI0036701151